MPKVSIIIPVYNVEKYLRQCLDSVINQTLKDIEIICIDDGSPDNCPAIIDEYAKNDKRIVAIHKENGGYASAINKGLDIAKGEFIGIVESDDFVESTMFEELYNEIKNTDADYIISDIYYYREEENCKIKKIIKEEDKQEYYNLKISPMLARVVGYPWNNIYRLSFLNDNNIRMLDDGNGAYEDQPWKATILSKANKIIYLDKPFYYYRTNAAMSSTNNGSRKLLNHITRRKQVRTIYIENNVYSNEVMENYYSATLSGYLKFLKKISSEYKEEYYIKMREALKIALEQDNLTYKYFSAKKKEHFLAILNKDYAQYKKWLKWKEFNKNFLGIYKTKEHTQIAILGIKIKIKREKYLAKG